MTTAVDVLVVGGGPAGTATASLLAREGWRVALIDRAVFPRPKPCGDYVNPGCDHVLERLGLRHAVAEAAVTVPGMRVVTADGQSIALPFAERPGRSIMRAKLDHVLLKHAAAAGVAVRDGCRLASLEADAHAVRATVEHGARTEAYIARLIIGADGLRSTVARAAGIDVPVRRGRYTIGAYLEGLAEYSDLEGLAENSDPHPARVPTRAAPEGSPAGAAAPHRGGRWGELHLRPEGYCGVAYLTGGIANVTLAVPRPVLRMWRGNIEAAYWAWLRGCPGLRDRVAGARRVGAFTAVGPLGFHHRRAGRGRVLLVGDSGAHADPMTGQGVYLALRGAELCAAAASRALAGAGVPSVRTYALARWREFAPVFAAARVLQSLAFRQRAVRRGAARLAWDTDLRSRLIGVAANTQHPGAVLHPTVLPRLLGWL